MNHKELMEHLSVLHRSMEQMLTAKASDYAGSVDRFGNFKRRAEVLHCSAALVIFSDMTKHVDAVGNILTSSTGAQVTQGLEERYLDLIVYGFLGWAKCRESSAVILPAESTPKQETYDPWGRSDVLAKGR